MGSVSCFEAIYILKVRQQVIGGKHVYNQNLMWGVKFLRTPNLVSQTFDIEHKILMQTVKYLMQNIKFF